MRVIGSAAMFDATQVTRRNSLVSVIIPTYNYGHFLVDCVNSVLEQTVKNIEIIVIDDGSSDNTSEIIKTFGNMITYIFQQNKGLSAARNTGLKHASGDFVQFLDSDDLLGINAIEAKVNFLDRNPGISVAVSPSLEFSSVAVDGRPETNGCWHLHRRNLDVHLAYLNIAPPHAFLMRRTVVEHVGYFNESLKACEDYDYWLRAAAFGYVPHYGGEGSIVYYRKHPASMSANRKKQYYYDCVLHRTVLELFLRNSKIPVSQNHWLAFIAGILTTLSRVELRHDPIRDELIALFFEGLQDASSYLPPAFEKLDSSGFFYWRVASQRLRQLAELNDPKLRSISDDSRLRSTSLASDRFKLYWRLAKSARNDLSRIIQGWRDDPLDGPNFARIASRYLFIIKNTPAPLRYIWSKVMDRFGEDRARIVRRYRRGRR
jgi:glycosyltransferase involved in cell wall biosynthesis